MFSEKDFQLDSEIICAMRKQEKWRQKQVDIFYRSGKPIFNITPDTMFLRSHNNPAEYRDKRNWE